MKFTLMHVGVDSRDSWHVSRAAVEKSVNNFFHVFHAQRSATRRKHAQVSANRGNPLSARQIFSKTHVIPPAYEIQIYISVDRCSSVVIHPEHPPALLSPFLAASFHQEPPTAVTSRHIISPTQFAPKLVL
jgi:hypothetical protein